MFQSEGHYTDEEAFTICAQQYLCGGLVMISERLPELQEDRMALLRHIAPACAPPARIIDFDSPVCPTLFLTEVTPHCSTLGTWWTLAVGNWEDEPVTKSICLGEAKIPSGPGRLAVMEFRTQEFIGLFGPGEPIEITVPAHGIRVLRLTPWDGQAPKILGTDFHITGGACEIVECSIKPKRIEGTIARQWNYPITITAAFPQGSGGIAVAKNTVATGDSIFDISLPM